MVTRRKPKLDATAAVALLRVSTDRDRQDLGLDAQRASIERWAAASGIRIVGWHVEEISGGASLDKRPVLLEAIADVEAQRAGALVFARWDRFTREPLTLATVETTLARSGARLVSADGTANGDDPGAEMMRTILAAVAKYEKAMIKARIKAALAIKQARGEMTGRAPYGMRAVPGQVRIRKDGTEYRVPCLVEDEGEQAVIAKAKALKAEGHSVRGIVEELEALGMMNRAGKPFGVAALHAILAA